MTKPQPGDRIRLVAMPDDPDPVPRGTTGTVRSVRPCGSGRNAWFQVDVDWDNGRKLMLAVPSDQFEAISHDAKAEPRRWQARLDWPHRARSRTRGPA